MIWPLHLGSLHPYEQALTYLLAFGPFVVLAVVVAVRRRRREGRQEPVDDGPDDGSDGEAQRER